MYSLLYLRTYFVSLPLDFNRVDYVEGRGRATKVDS